MIPEQGDPYQKGGLALLLGAMLFLILAFLDTGSPLAPLLILSALGLFLTGLLVLSFSRGDTPDPVVTGFAPVQHQINTAQLLSRAGSRDPALIFPSPEQPGKVMQFHALPFGTAGSRDTGAGSVRHGDTTGILLAPAGLPLLRELEGRFHLRIPSDPDRIPQLLQEVGEEMLAIAGRVATTPEAEGIRVDLQGFALYPGCRTVHETSPAACSLHPCAVCSLLACLVVRATGKECHLHSVALDDRTETVRLEFSFRPPVREEPNTPTPVEVVPEMREGKGTGEPVSPLPSEPEVPAVPPVPIVPVPAEVVPPVPAEVVSPIAPEAVPPVQAEAGIPTVSEGGSLSMGDMVARAMRDLVSPKGTETAVPGMEALISRLAEEPVTPIPEELTTRGLQQPASVAMEREEPVLPGEPESSAPAEPLARAPPEPAPPVPVEPEDPVWWIRHPGSRRVRYLRKDEEVTPAGGEPVPSNPGEPPAPGKESPEIRVPTEEPAGPPKKKSASSRSQKKTTGGRKKRKPPAGS